MICSRLDRFRPDKHGGTLVISKVLVYPLSVLLLLGTPASGTEPIRALLITGGCCHDYPEQAKIISDGLTARANIEWTIILDSPGNSTNHQLSIYERSDWAKGYDVVVHNECFADVTD